MQLPSQLRSTTLGDVLGVVHRAAMTGSVELVEPHGRTHRVYISRGAVTAVDVDRATPSLAEVLRREDAIDEDTLRRSLLRAMASKRLHGEVLVSDFCLAPELVDRALRQQLLTRLHVLDQLADARISFRVTVRPPRGAMEDRPLRPAEFLHGRRRARDRMHDGAASFPGARARRDHRPNGIPDPMLARAFAALGVGHDASEVEIKAAYRKLVRAYHPDLHPGAGDEEKRALSQRFAEVTAAYKKLVA